MRFLRESLEDLDQQLVEFGGRLHVVQGGATETLKKLFKVRSFFTLDAVYL